MGGQGTFGACGAAYCMRCNAYRHLDLCDMMVLQIAGGGPLGNTDMVYRHIERAHGNGNDLYPNERTVWNPPEIRPYLQHNLSRKRVARIAGVDPNGGARMGPANEQVLEVMRFRNLGHTHAEKMAWNRRDGWSPQEMVGVEKCKRAGGWFRGGEGQWLQTEEEWKAVRWDGNGLAYPHRTGARPVSDQCHAGCTVHVTMSFQMHSPCDVTMSCQMQRHVGCKVSFRMHSLDRNS